MFFLGFTLTDPIACISKKLPEGALFCQYIAPSVGLWNMRGITILIIPQTLPNDFSDVVCK
jgi:hypothetical protein